jgi:hypothetical protein
MHIGMLRQMIQFGSGDNNDLIEIGLFCILRSYYSVVRGGNVFLLFVL